MVTLIDLYIFRETQSDTTHFRQLTRLNLSQTIYEGFFSHSRNIAYSNCFISGVHALKEQMFYMDHALFKAKEWAPNCPLIQ